MILAFRAGATGRSSSASWRCRLVSAAGAWTQCRWIPGLPRRGVGGTGPMVRFALNIYGYFTVNYFSRQP